MATTNSLGVPLLQEIDSIYAYVDSLGSYAQSITDKMVFDTLYAKILRAQLSINESGKREEALHYNKMLGSITAKLEKHHPRIAGIFRQGQYHLNPDFFVTSEMKNSSTQLNKSAAVDLPYSGTPQMKELEDVCSFFLIELDGHITLESITKLSIPLIGALTDCQDETSANLLSQLLDLGESSTLQDLNDRCANIKTLLTLYLETLSGFKKPGKKKTAPSNENIPYFPLDTETGKKIADVFHETEKKLVSIADGRVHWNRPIREEIYQILHALLEDPSPAASPYSQLLAMYKQNPFVSSLMAKFHYAAINYLAVCFEEVNKCKILAQHHRNSPKKRAHAEIFQDGDLDMELLEIETLRSAFQLRYKNVCEEIIDATRHSLQQHPHSQELKITLVAAWGLLLDYCPRLYPNSLAETDCQSLGVVFADVEDQFLNMRKNYWIQFFPE